MAREEGNRLGLILSTALGAVALSNASGGAQALVTESLLPILRVWDGLDSAFDARSPLTREAERVDARPLRLQAQEMERDLYRDFTLLDGRLVVMDTPPSSLGDACLWQGVFTAAAVWRYRVEASSSALALAERAFDGLQLLASRGRPIARAVYPAGLLAEPGGIQYHRDGDWQWKEDASIDSAAGWVFGNVVALKHLPTRRSAAARALAGFSDALAENGYRLRNSDGSATRFGAVGGSLLNSPTGLLATFAALQGSGQRRHREEVARFEARRQDRWAAYASGPFLWKNLTTNHNIGFLGLAAAAAVERDPGRRELYLRGMLRLERLTAKSGNSFWIYLTLWTLDEAAGAEKLSPKLESYRRRRVGALNRARNAMLEWDYPRSKVKRPVVNSRRRDLEFSRWPWFWRRNLRQPLPVWRRPPADFLWQRCAYALDDWEEYRLKPPQRFAPLDFLAAYYLGRLVGAFGPAD